MPASFLAQIELLPAHLGGRVGPLLSGEWRTIFGVNNEHWSARLLFEGEPRPGQTFQATVQLLMQEAESRFPVGAKFTVWEGTEKGTGRVILSAA